MNVRERLVTSVSSALCDRTVACAESVTSGRIAALLASAQRATTFSCGGLVAYQPAVKANLLGVVAHRIVSADTAVQMAVGVDGRVDARRHRFTGPPRPCGRAATRALTDLVRHLVASMPMGMEVDVALAVLDAGGELSGFDELKPLVEGPNSA